MHVMVNCKLVWTFEHLKRKDPLSRIKLEPSEKAL